MLSGVRLTKMIAGVLGRLPGTPASFAGGCRLRTLAAGRGAVAGHRDDAGLEFRRDRIGVERTQLAAHDAQRSSAKPSKSPTSVSSSHTAHAACASSAA